MDYKYLHDWPTTATDAIALQRQLAQRVQTNTPLPFDPNALVAGADISYLKYDPILYASVVVLRAGNNEVVERVSVAQKALFPYVPGLLSFREVPPLLEAFAKVKHEPTLIFCDGQGLAHPRGLGLACHLGLWLQRPCLGCAKSLLVGHFWNLGPQRGDRAPLMHKGQEVGRAVRTKKNVNPVFISSGHRIDLESAVAWTLACDGGYRIPEPTRQAHLLANEARLKGEGTK
jgi:deoxyribonuclease V